MGIEYFCAYNSYLSSIRNLSDEECGRLFRALLRYSAGDKSARPDGRESIAFDFIADQIDRDCRQYEEKCKRNRSNAMKAKHSEINRTVATACENERTAAKQAKEKEKEKKKEKKKDNNILLSPPVSPPVGETHTPEKEKTARRKYGQYGWVLLSEQEYNNLLHDIGHSELERCIAYVDELAQQSGNKNKWKDWNLVIRKASREGWGIGRQIANRQPAPQKETSYDLDEIERMISNPGGKFG